MALSYLEREEPLMEAVTALAEAVEEVDLKLSEMVVARLVRRAPLDLSVR